MNWHFHLHMYGPSTPPFKTCHMYVPRLTLRDTVTILKLYFNIVNVVEWSQMLAIGINYCGYSISRIWVRTPLTMSLQEYNSSTLGFHFHTHVCKSVRHLVFIIITIKFSLGTITGCNNKMLLSFSDTCFNCLYIE